MFGERVHKIAVDAGLTCPNRDGTLSFGGCIYCNFKGSGTGLHNQGLSITQQIVNAQDYIAKRYKAKKYLIYFQSFSNTYAPFDRLKSIYEEALNAIDGVIGLSIGTRPDCVDEKILRLLQAYAQNYLIWIEYGLQSVHNATLEKINRGHDFACFQNAVNITKDRGINICVHVILGLPGEKRHHMMETAKIISDMGLDGIKLHLMYVVKGTKLDSLYQQGQYKCLEQEEYSALVCEFLEYLPSDMVIQRLTGDPHYQELAAPQWALDKNKTINMILETMEKQNSWQGKQYKDRKIWNQFSQ